MRFSFLLITFLIYKIIGPCQVGLYGQKRMSNCGGCSHWLQLRFRLMQFIIMATICPSDNQQKQQATKATQQQQHSAIESRLETRVTQKNIKVKTCFPFCDYCLFVAVAGFLVALLFYCIMCCIWLWLFNRASRMVLFFSPSSLYLLLCWPPRHRSKLPVAVAV